MGISELYEVHLTLIETLDRIYEMWIAITFAVVVATTLGSSYLTNALRVFVTLLYLVVSIYIALRITILIELIVVAAERLTNADEPILSSLTGPMVWAGIATYWIGILGTLYVIWRKPLSSLKTEQEEP